MRVKAGLIFLAAAGGIFSLGALVAPPWAHSLPLFDHSAAAGLSNAHCLSGDAWAVTLTITATNPELHPTATVVYTGNQMQGLDLSQPYTHQFTTTAPSWTATAHIVWSDGFTQDKGPFTATRPNGCGTPPPTSGTTTTTTCAQAIPPRSDCGGTTSTTTPPTASTSAPVTTVGISDATTVAAPLPSSSTTTPSSPGASTTRPNINLPATGTGDWLLPGAILAVILIIVGGTAWGIGKRIDRSHEGEQ